MGDLRCGGVLLGDEAIQPKFVDPPRLDLMAGDEPDSAGTAGEAPFFDTGQLAA